MDPPTSRGCGHAWADAPLYSPRSLATGANGTRPIGRAGFSSGSRPFETRRGQTGSNSCQQGCGGGHRGCASSRRRSDIGTRDKEADCSGVADHRVTMAVTPIDLLLIDRCSMKRQCMSLMVAALTAACATPSEFSYLNGQRWSRVEINTFDTRIVSVDGFTRSQNERLFVEPGIRRVVLEAAPVGGFAWPVQRELVLDIEPCTQYWFEAKRVNPLAQDWEPRVNHREPVAGCRQRD